MIAGAHESVAGGLFRAIERATADGCGALQIFTKNSGMWREPELTDDQVLRFREAHAEAGSPPVMAHTSYLINLAAESEDIFVRSKNALLAEVERTSALGISYCVLHPGAHLGRGEEAALERVVEAIDDVHGRAPTATSKILLENTAGQGTCIGHRFEHLAYICAHVAQPHRIAVCFDTQHAFASGYDLSTREGYERTFEEFDATIGLARLAAFHLNDSKKPLGSRVDRHESLGEGLLGLPLFWRLMNDPRFVAIPGVVETEPQPGDFPYQAEVALLRGLVAAPEPPPRGPEFRRELAPEPGKTRGSSVSTARKKRA